MATWSTRPAVPTCFILHVLLVGFNWKSTAAHNDMFPVASRNSDMQLCPLDCTCSSDVEATRLSVDCINRTDGSSSQLTDELNQLLQHSFLNLTELEIVNSPLASVPASVCRLTNLKILKLEHNQLSELPVKCFTVMDKLEEFSVEYNELTEIQVCSNTAALVLIYWMQYFDVMCNDARNIDMVSSHMKQIVRASDV
jgi:Leucine rich repeat